MFTGDTGLLTLASGLRLGTFSGSSPASAQAGSFNNADIATFQALLQPPLNLKSSIPTPAPPPPDILLTHCLPASLPLLSAKPFLPAPGSAVPELDEVAKVSKAKYHFIGGAGGFWEREPFAWTGPGGGGTCRAISLGEMGNKGKERVSGARSSHIRLVLG